MAGKQRWPGSKVGREAKLAGKAENRCFSAVFLAQGQLRSAPSRPAGAPGQLYYRNSALRSCWLFVLDWAGLIPSRRGAKLAGKAEKRHFSAVLHAQGQLRFGLYVALESAWCRRVRGRGKAWGQGGRQGEGEAWGPVCSGEGVGRRLERGGRQGEGRARRGGMCCAGYWTAEVSFITLSM
ncbi:hypothetical protein CAQUA_01690 [Corynebacterium aquatimens]|uniref:Uncharacterized protein n=1 Tax=Corynebacterium aquatimens TaxID=1190508 RepID=A0A931GWB9_9CORY|nr:hypothetical protein [Corynebacterium aquatimens]WJY65071.1 hypothetical protein CAQUA_01690 [Corynebacterium aquatimens]